MDKKNISISYIDDGQTFDWGKTSEDYAKYRDIYPDEYAEFFNLVSQEEFRVEIPFTRESWHGRMRACRGVGASMSPEKLKKWDEEHWNMLENHAPEKFNVKHYVSIAVLERKTVSYIP